jgi:hypothetical protein
MYFQYMLTHHTKIYQSMTLCVDLSIRYVCLQREEISNIIASSNSDGSDLNDDSVTHIGLPPQSVECYTVQ